MTRIDWDTGARVFSQGVQQAVLYPQNGPGVAWNGLTSVTEKGESAPGATYVEGQKVGDNTVPSIFTGTLAAYTYPDEFELYAGVVSGITAQNRPSFGLSYRTSSEIHILYNVSIVPPNAQFQTLDDSPSPTTFSWDVVAVPVLVPFVRPTAHLVVALSEASPDAISDLEALIYGDDSDDPTLPDPSTVIGIFESHTTLMITDNGNGTWSATGPDDVVSMLDGVTFQIDWPSAKLISTTEYILYSL
jgi:hypothetical protein